MNQKLPPTMQEVATVPQGEIGEDALWLAYAETESIQLAYGAWLTLQCSMIKGARQGVLVLGVPDTGPYVPSAVWPPGAIPGPVLAEVAGDSLAQRRALVVSRESHGVVASPILVDGHLHGVVAVESDQTDELLLQRQSRQLRWGCAGVEALLRRELSLGEQKTRERLIATLDLVASALTEDDFSAAAQTLATDLALRLDCDRVSIGFVKERTTQVVALSHSAEFGERMNLIRAIGTAMDEAIDQKSIMVLPLRDDETLVTRDHEALARQFGSSSLLTIPFSVGDSSVGAVTFERPYDRPFDPDTVELCQAVVALGSRILEARRLNDRPLRIRIKNALQAEISKLLGQRHFGRKLAASLVMLAAIFLSFATGEHRVAATATLEGSVRRVLVAPFDGYVATATHRAGDVVAAGTVLATLDERDLRLEYYRSDSQRSQYGKQYQEALAMHDRPQAAITLAQIAQAEAEMNLAAEQLSRTQLTAPFDGIVVSGDMHQSLGSAVRRGQVLFEVAPLNAYRVVLDVDEADITFLQTHQTGALTLTSIPGEAFPLRITQITPVALAREGRSYFRVEAMLVRNIDRLRPGMEGVAKIDTGSQKLLWIWTHKLVDWLRLTLWTWL
ncbi:MAG: HlyD family efflux transporter periplasmic adaptor subunit [Rhodocyclaceae bacterium]|nr:HlyD family efflux transporter periplasmic adaptor subunit [Rhodocyclaceae bacterium]